MNDDLRSDHRADTPLSLGDVVAAMTLAGELPPADARTLPSTPRSSPTPSHLISITRCCCNGVGLLTEDLAQAQANQRVIVDCFEVAGQKRALVPCVCAAGQARIARWRGLPEEATGVRLRGGRVKQITDQAKALAAITDFIKQPRGWVTLAGDYGTGKTTLIYAALNHLADRGIYGRYVMMPDLINDLRAALWQDQQTYTAKLHRISTVPILALDELDKIRDSAFVDDVLYAIFLARYQERQRYGTLIGYNLAGAERIPAFLASRIRDSRFQLIEMTGPDLRPIADRLDPWHRGEGSAPCEQI